MSASSRLHLLKILCDNLLFGEKFETIKSKLEKSVERTNARLDENKQKLIKILQIDEKEFSKHKEKHINGARKMKLNSLIWIKKNKIYLIFFILIFSKPSVNKILDAIEKNQKKLEVITLIF